MNARIGEQLVSEMRGAITPGPRLYDELACVASVMLGIVFAHAIGARMVSWAAFSAFVLMKSDLAETMLRAIMRIAGTVLGAALAMVVVPLVVHSLPAAMVCAGLIGAAGLYGAITARHAYGWLLFGLTFEMILLDKLERPGLDTSAFAHTRLLEVTAGTFACVLVSVLTNLVARRGWPQVGGMPASVGWHPHAARHAAQAGIALAVLPLLHTLWHLPELAQAGVTIMAVMIVPVTGIGASGLVPVSRRLAHRVLGCLAGGVLAGAILLVSGRLQPEWQAGLLVLGTGMGIAVGRRIENGSPRATYVGLQFSLAVLVTLVPDSYANADIHPALQRLASIFIGMALLEPVLLVWHLFAPGERGVETDGQSSLSE